MNEKLNQVEPKYRIRVAINLFVSSLILAGLGSAIYAVEHWPEVAPFLDRLAAHLP